MDVEQFEIHTLPDMYMCFSVARYETVSLQDHDWLPMILVHARNPASHVRTSGHSSVHL